VRAGLALIVLVLNVFAIVSILATRRGTVRRVGWTVAVVLLPLIGSIGWLAVGRRTAARRGR
jgi:hypothetical protein